MKIVTYNINGIRASANKGIVKWFNDTNADIYALQEIRADEQTTNQTLYGNFIENVNAYDIIFNPSKKAGYSGTAILTKRPYKSFSFGFPPDPNYNWQDTEGRLITVIYDTFTLVNCYVPNGGTRQDYKMDFYKRLTAYLQDLSKSAQVIFCSDSNIAHTEDDVSDPAKASTKTGFLPYERDAFTNLLNKGFYDSFRTQNPHGKAFSWFSYKERNFNIDSIKYRFDYILTTKAQNDKLVSSHIDTTAPFSDHCPVINEYNK